MEEEGPKRVLVVASHPDDAEFTSGGTLAKWAREGADIRYVVCTDGSKGGDDLEIDDVALRDLRESEQRAATEILGVRDVVFLRYPDGDLASAGDLRRSLVVMIRRWRPDILLTWDAWRPYQLHPDHRATGLAAVEAVLAAGNPRRFRELVAEGLPAHRVGEVYLFGTDNPDKRVDISETFERKLKAIACHRSQVSDVRGVAAQMDGCNRSPGEQQRVSYSEGFKVLHPFCER
ncbi:MAG: PIG-L deacetylase family protein [Dehalococcoidia bacterium]|nr:PIG-L deacetylase family protein [Dehalococcoidia bacterium]